MWPKKKACLCNPQAMDKCKINLSVPWKHGTEDNAKAVTPTKRPRDTDLLVSIVADNQECTAESRAIMGRNLVKGFNRVVLKNKNNRFEKTYWQCAGNRLCPDDSLANHTTFDGVFDVLQQSYDPDQIEQLMKDDACVSAYFGKDRIQRARDFYRRKHPDFMPEELDTKPAAEDKDENTNPLLDVELEGI